MLAGGCSISRRLHKLDGCAVGVANIDHAFARVRSGLKGLRLACCVPTGCGNFIQYGINIINR